MTGKGQPDTESKVAFVSGTAPEVPVTTSAATCIPKITLPLTSKFKFKESWQIALNHIIGFGSCKLEPYNWGKNFDVEFFSGYF